MKKRVLSLLLTLVMLLGLLPAGAWAMEGNITISTPEELKAFAAEVNGGATYEGRTVTLAADIDLGGSESDQWTPIGTEDDPFKGAFDGGGHKVAGLYINASTFKHCGLFGYLDVGGTVKDLGVEGSVTCSYSNSNIDSYSGGVVGHNVGTVEHCSYIGSVSGTKTYCIAGGVVGGNGAKTEFVPEAGGEVVLASGTVRGCYHVGGEVSAPSSAGGVVGINCGTLKTSYNTGTVCNTVSNYAGGVAGQNWEGTVENCYNTGSVSGSGTGVGGVVGWNRESASVIADCYFQYDKASKAVGVNDGTSNAVSKAGSVFSNQTSYASSWDFDSVWRISAALGRPILVNNPEQEPTHDHGGDTYAHQLTVDSNGRLLSDGKTTETTVTGYYWSDLPTKDDAEPYTYYLGGASDVLESHYKLETRADIDLCLKGKTLRFTGDGIIVEAGDRVTISDCDGGGQLSAKFAPVYVKCNGNRTGGYTFSELVLESGKVVRTGTEYSSAAIVCSGYATLKGGQVSGPYAVRAEYSSDTGKDRPTLTLVGAPVLEGTVADVAIDYMVEEEYGRPEGAPPPLIDATAYTGDALTLAAYYDDLEDAVDKPIVKLGSTRADKFQLEHPCYYLEEGTVDGANGLILRAKHNYTYTLDAEGKTITEACTNENGCGHSEGGVSFSVTGELTYAEDNKVEVNVGRPGWRWRASQAKVSYTKNGQTVAEARETGRYIAVVTFSDREGNTLGTLEYPFTITPPHAGHPICGTDCGHTPAHEAVEWKPLTQDSFTGGGDGKPQAGSGVTLSSDQYTLAEGHYYLAGEVSLDKRIYIDRETVDLCLNGHTLTSEIVENSGTLNSIEVRDEATLNLSDCAGGGEITSNAYYTLEIKQNANSFANLYGGTVSSPAGICVESRGNVLLDGATLKADKSHVIDAQAESTVVIKSGKVEGGSSENCVQMNSSNATFTMTGGTVTNTGSGHGVYVGQRGGVISGGVIHSEKGYGIYLSGTSATLSGAPAITGGEAGIGINSNGSVTVGENLTGSYSVLYAKWRSITEGGPFTFTAAAGADHSGHFTAAEKMTGIAVGNSGTGSGQRVQLYMPHNWSSGWTKNATHHWHICHNSAEGNCTISDYAACGEEGAAYGSHQWSYETNTRQHRQKCTVCGYAESSWTPHTWTDDHDLDCNVCGYERTVPLYGTVTIAGTAKLGVELTASVSGAPEGVALQYAWTAAGSDAVLGTGAAYTPTADQVGKTLTVTVTTGDERYTGSITAVSAAVAKGDQAAPADIFTITDAEYGQITGTIAITGDAGKLEYRAKPTGGSEPAWANASGSNTLPVGTYEFRYKETATHNASPATQMEIRVLSADAKSLTIDPAIEHGTVTKRRDKVNPGDPVTLAVKPGDGYELSAIAANYNDGEAKTITPTVKPDNAQQYTFTMPAYDVTVTAVFSPIAYTIDYQWEGVADGSFTVETDPLTLAVPVREGYTLLGWAFAEGGEALENVTAAALMAKATRRTVKLYPVWTAAAPGEVDVEVDRKPDTPPVTVKEETLKELAGTPEEGQTITVKLTVEKQDAPADKDALEAVVTGKKDDVLYLDLSLDRITVSGHGAPVTQHITDTGDKVLEIAVDYGFTGKKDVTVYRKHGAEPAEALRALSAQPAGDYADGSFFADSAQGKVYIYASKFSTYAIGYTAQATAGGGASDNYYTLTATAGEGGSISPRGKVTVRQGTRKSFTITPDAGYVIADVLVDGKSVGAVESYVFQQVSRRHTIEASFRKTASGTPECPRDAACPISKFADASATQWYHDGVHYCVEKGLMVGTGETTFAPAMDTSRAMIATILWRQSGSPEPKAGPAYPDCVQDSWYAKAVAWATEAGVVKGYDSGSFGPNDPITREQLAVMLWRYAKAKGQDVSVGEDTNILSYLDVDQAGEWAIPALQWAAGSGVVKGKDGGRLDPKGLASRAEAATMLMRYLERG